MALGKNPRLSKGKKGGKKKVGDPFLRKEWYVVRAPNVFNVPKCGVTLVTKTTGNKLASDSLKGRVFELNLADLQNDDDQGFRKIQLCCEDVVGRDCQTDFYGMDMTRDRLCSLVRKWQTTIETTVTVRTLDGFTLRIFCLAFTARKIGQVKSTCYAQASQIRSIRRHMEEIVKEESERVVLKDLVRKFIADSIAKEMEKKCRSVFPLQNVYIRKAKVIKKPKLDLTRLRELHDITSGAAGEFGKKVGNENPEARNLLDQPVAAAAGAPADPTAWE